MAADHTDVRRHFKPEVEIEARRTLLKFHARLLLRRLIELSKRESKTKLEMFRGLESGEMIKSDPEEIRRSLYG